jgi:hypothetical protein
MYNVMVTVSLDSPSCEVTLFDPVSVVYRDVTRQVKGLYRLKYVGALWSGLAYLSRYNSGWIYHTWLVGEEEQGTRRPNSGEGGGGGWRRTGLRAPGAHDASMGELGRKRGWLDVRFPRRPRRRRRGACRRGASRRGGWPSSGLIAAARGGEAIGMVRLDGGGAEVRARRRQDLTGEE